jgi:hypothetical protein
LFENFKRYSFQREFRWFFGYKVAILSEPLTENVIGGMADIIAQTAKYRNYKNAIGYYPNKDNILSIRPDMFLLNKRN